MVITSLEEQFLIVLSEHYHVSLRKENMFLDYHLTCNSVKPFGYLSTQTTLNPGVLVNFLCPNLSALRVYICSYLPIPRLLCVHWIPLTFPNLLFWPKTPAGWVGRGKRRALGKKISRG